MVNAARIQAAQAVRHVEPLGRPMPVDDPVVVPLTLPGPMPGLALIARRRLGEPTPGPHPAAGHQSAQHVPIRVRGRIPRAFAQKAANPVEVGLGQVGLDPGGGLQAAGNGPVGGDRGMDGQIGVNIFA